MSSWKAAYKGTQRYHRERHQPENRAHLGFLEKKKDYKLRAVDHNKKKRTIKLLQKKALNKNPDEFYFHMINSKTVDGVHQEREKDDEHTPEQIMLMQSQDLRYITMKRTMEMKKIEQLQAQLHMLDAANQTPNKHLFFVDSKKDLKKFNIAKHLETHPSLLGRRINRLKLKDLEELSLDVSEESAKKLALERKKMYTELAKRVEREKQLGIIQQKLEIKKHLLATSSDVKFKRVKPATKDAPPVYEWQYRRKR